MLAILKKLFYRQPLNSEEGSYLLEAVIALAIGGGVCYLCISGKIMPGMKGVWDGQIATLKNAWFN